MRIIVLITSCLVIGCNADTSTKCLSYEEGAKYFEKHYQGDYMDYGSQDTIITLFQKALENGCENFDLYYKLFFCYEWNGDFMNAEKYISEAIKMDKNKNPELFYWKGEMNLKLNQLEEAKSAFSNYVSFPNALHSHLGFYRVGVIQYVLGDTINSEINRRKAIELNKGESSRNFKEFAEALGLHK